MSQSDYLKYKRVSTRLRVDNDTTNQPPVFKSSTLHQNQQYALVNSITNTKPVYNRLVPSDRKSVFGMEKAVSGCPTFPVCTNTNLRTNRVPMTCRADPTVPSPEPLNIMERNEAVNMRNACKCALHRSYTNENSCSCKLGAFGIVR
jgi:hypothetical protein